MHKIYAIVVEVKFLHVVKEANEWNRLDVIMRKGQNSDIGESLRKLLDFRENVVVKVELCELVEFVEEWERGNLIVGEV